METHLIPSTPSQLLALSPSTASSIDFFSDGIIQEVKEGTLNPLSVLIQLRAIKQASERILEEIKTEMLNEASKYPEKTFKFAGNDITKAEHGTKYDYTVCNDAVWFELENKFKAAKSAKEKREEWLKTMAGKETLVDQDTGLVTEIFPPMKTSQSGLNVSIK